MIIFQVYNCFCFFSQPESTVSQQPQPLYIPNVSFSYAKLQERADGFKFFLDNSTRKLCHNPNFSPLFFSVFWPRFVWFGQFPLNRIIQTMIAVSIILSDLLHTLLNQFCKLQSSRTRCVWSVSSWCAARIKRRGGCERGGCGRSGCGRSGCGRSGCGRETIIN